MPKILPFAVFLFTFNLLLLFPSCSSSFGFSAIGFFTQHNHHKEGIHAPVPYLGEHLWLRSFFRQAGAAYNLCNFFFSFIYHRPRGGGRVSNRSNTHAHTRRTRCRNSASFFTFSNYKSTVQHRPHAKLQFNDPHVPVSTGLRMFFTRKIARKMFGCIERRGATAKTAIAKRTLCTGNDTALNRF